MNFNSNGQPSSKEVTKTCKYCGKEIPESATVCPYCRKKQSHTVRNVVLIIAGVIVLLVLLFACVGGGGDDESTTNNNATAPTESTDNNNSAPAQTDYTVGSTFTYKDVSATLNSVTVSTGDEFNTPQEGYVYLISNWTVTNNGTTDYNPFDFGVEFYIDGQTTETAITGLPDQFDRGTTIIPGTSSTGNLVLEVPQNWTQLQERVDLLTSSLDSEKATFTITPSQVS